MGKSGSSESRHPTDSDARPRMAAVPSLGWEGRRAGSRVDAEMHETGCADRQTDRARGADGEREVTPLKKRGGG